MEILEVLISRNEAHNKNIEELLSREIDSEAIYLNYYMDGRIKEAHNEIVGERYGKVISFHRNGNKKEETNYEGGEKHGEYRKFHRGGEIKGRGTYKCGHLQGDFVEYRKDGSLRGRSLMEKGELKECSCYDRKERMTLKMTYSGGKLDGRFEVYAKDRKTKFVGICDNGKIREGETVRVGMKNFWRMSNKLDSAGYCGGKKKLEVKKNILEN